MLTERQKLILRAVVDDYVMTAEPVGSRTVSKREGVGFSAATIRNEMADLEEMGYLEQPHTSAGRIPSHKGYRYYVDHLMEPARLSRMEMMAFRRFFARKRDEVEQVIQETASILSQMTNYTSIILGPKVFESTLKHLQVIPLSERAAVVIFVTNTGHVEKRRISVPDGVSLSSIEKLVNLLNTKLTGVPLYKLKRVVYWELMDELRRHVDHYESVMSMLDQMLETDHGERVFFSGATNMLNQPEFQDVEKVKTLLDLFENSETMVQLFESMEEGVQVRIGRENDLEAVNNCSIISATYTVDGRPLGTIGILGPTRMDYRKVITILDVFSKHFSEHLRRLY